MSKFQISEIIRKYLVNLKSPDFRIKSIDFELDNLQIIAKVNFRFNDDFDFSGSFVVNKRQLQLILTPSEYEQLVQLIIDDIKG